MLIDLISLIVGLFNNDFVESSYNSLAVYLLVELLVCFYLCWFICSPSTFLSAASFFIFLFVVTSKEEQKQYDQKSFFQDCYITRTK